ncbi:hypothetical protein A1C_04835 [Rickettsia akari str. Hartford]|uniref:Uncharacterized protein n=1 Tax=Rickettsia akari (strain Hartford) TaxID=293614 RepID=A8GPA0_RICAH|nr:PIN domain-containing protein [Rickettsia akari]ABV75225.1 hypothetical protein A1C_04835 [Rickettsia akari str. Hartford]
MQYICDTNVIVRYLFADDKNMFNQTKEMFEQVKTGHITLIIEHTVFTDVIFVLSSVYKISLNKISSTLSDLLAYKGVHCEKEYYLNALEYYTKCNIHTVGILLAKAKYLSMPLLTFDQKLLECSQ